MVDIGAIREVECENCGMIFMMRRAVVLDASGEYHYFCEKGCAYLWKKASGVAAREVPLEEAAPAS